MAEQSFIQILGPHATAAVLIVAASVAAAVLIAVIAVVAGALRAVMVARSEAALKGMMVERGMSASEIVAVVEARVGGTDRRISKGGADTPFACEAVAERDGEWSPALVLRTDGARYFVHFVGTEMDENEWVGHDRIRFPAGSPLQAHAAEWAPAKGPMQVEV